MEMRGRGRLRAKHHREELEEAERDESYDEKSSQFVFAAGSSDDDDKEANEDLSLKIVEKALSMRAAKPVPDGDEPNGFDGVLDPPRTSSSQEVEVVAGPSKVAKSENGDLQNKKIIKSVRKRKKKTGKSEIVDATVSVCLFLFAFALFVSLEKPFDEHSCKLCLFLFGGRHFRNRMRLNNLFATLFFLFLNFCYELNLNL